MLGRIEIFLRTLRRWGSRSEWAIRLLHLARAKEITATLPGLVMVQIDGLSHRQFKRALEKGKMPFLRHLLKRQRYRLHTHYSGLPSSTPGVQGELFYGVRAAVPAFSFMERKNGRIIRMFDPDPAAKVEKRLEKQGDPLLKEGSAYSDIYTGGAAESHFCSSSLGLDAVMQAVNPISLLILIISNIYSVARIAVYLVVEFFLAIYDCIRGLFAGRDILKELKFIPTRVGICILLRELLTIGTKVDIARGLPIIHLNLIGYDEQAHRRGPTSLFAHWALKGIDDSIARIWRAARHSTRRNYDIWIYSDHGQEAVLSYQKQFGRTIEEAVVEVFDLFENTSFNPNTEDRRGVQSQRIRLLGGKKIQKIFPVPERPEKTIEISQPIVTTMGPVGMIYAPRPLERSERRRLARELVKTAKIPLVLIPEESKRLFSISEAGEFILPDDKEKVFGADHPFLDEIAADLIEMCRHPDAGDFIICGWSTGTPPYSFVIENGSHAGPGPEETKAFAMLPADTILPESNYPYLRPNDLRLAALHLLGRQKIQTVPKRFGDKAGRREIRIITYNVHGCIGMDGKISPERTARAIAQYCPDIVALQELDVGRERTDGIDQANLIAQYLQMECHFHPSMHVEKGLYGNAILTYLPMRLVKAGKLPGLPRKPGLEPRGALWAAIAVNGIEIQFFNTHLGLRSAERIAQVKSLLGIDWLAHPNCREPVIFCGDLNSTPRSPAYRRLRKRLQDSQIAMKKNRPRSTFFGRYPLTRLDHVFVGAKVEILNVKVPKTDLTSVASDHLPLIVDVRIHD